MTTEEDRMEPGVRTSLRDGQIGQSPLAHLGTVIVVQDEQHWHDVEQLAERYRKHLRVEPRFVTIERPRLRWLRLVWQHRLGGRDD